MSLFNKEHKPICRTFNKEEVIQEINDLLSNEFSSYKVINSKDDAWDLIIIRMVSHSVVLKLGTLGLHESTRECILQEVFAVNVMSPDEEIPEYIKEYSHGWTKAHYIISDAKTLKRKLTGSRI